MSFSQLFEGRSAEDIDRISEWEQIYLDIQVLLAFADERLDPSERVTLSILSLARDDHGNLEYVNYTVDRVQKQGLEEVADQVFRKAREMMQREPPELRTKIADHILTSSLSVVAADGVVSRNERRFVLYRMVPGLGLNYDQVKKRLDELDKELTLHRLYVERAFELFLMLVDEGGHDPVLSEGGDTKSQGFLGAVDELVSSRRLGSSAVMMYFLGALGGVAWVQRYRTFINYFERLAVQTRELCKTSGRQRRLEIISEEIHQLVSNGTDPFAVRSVSRHTLNALNKLEGMDEKQIALFRDEIAPVLDLEFDRLLRSLEGRPAMVRVLHNLQGLRPPASKDEAWWKFWA